MSFNLHAKRQKRLINKLRSLSDDCADLRPSDLDGMSEKEMHHVYHGLKGKTKTANVKTAVHGFGETWTPVPNDYSPYRTSPLVNYEGPEFGGRWRRDFPGAGDMHINDDSDKEKSLKGNAVDEDFDPQLQKTRINEMTEGIRGSSYVVRLRLTEEEEPSREKARNIFGEEGQTDGKSVFIIVNGFENALEWQRKLPQVTIEPKGN